VLEAAEKGVHRVEVGGHRWGYGLVDVVLPQVDQLGVDVQVDNVVGSLVLIAEVSEVIPRESAGAAVKLELLHEGRDAARGQVCESCDAPLARWQLLC
jgi:hypothetical protein